MPVDPAVIKKIVRENFNKSTGLYEQFEQDHGLFSYLTEKLADACNIQQGMKVADIGCGTGISSFALKKIVGEDGTVIGIDSSEEMLEIAVMKSRSAENSNLQFILCDADAFNSRIRFKMDSVLYNATIFLIPEPARTLKVAREILVEKGTVGMNYLAGLYSKNNENLFQLAKKAGKESAPYGRMITDGKVLPGILKDTGFTDIGEGKLVREMKLDEMKAFYSIPAQSAGLWPKHEYKKRLALLDSLVEYFEENSLNTCYQHWGWCSATRNK